VPGYNLDHEYNVLRAEVRASEAITASYSDNDWRALFRWGNFKRCIAAALPFAAQQFAGVPYIYNYTTYFFQLAGVEDPFLANTILNVIYVCSIVASFFLVDKVGRRPLVLCGLAVLTVINFIIGGLGFATKTSSSGTALTALCSLWIFSYSLTLAPLGWVGIVEVSSTRLRAKTAAFAVLVNSFVGLVFVSDAFGYMIDPLKI
jgi:MFS family permease